MRSDRGAPIEPGKRKPLGCGGCALDARCAGPWVGYLDRFGAGDLVRAVRWRDARRGCFIPITLTGLVDRAGSRPCPRADAGARAPEHGVAPALTRARAW